MHEGPVEVEDGWLEAQATTDEQREGRPPNLEIMHDLPGLLIQVAVVCCVRPGT